MTSIERIRVGWTGFIGQPGVSTFYATTGSTLIGPLRAFFNSLITDLPTDVHIQVENTGDVLESTTGEITGVWSAAAVAAVVGTSAVAYSGVTGALVSWATPTIFSGRKLRGHTFLVPFRGDGYDTSGQIAYAVRGGIDAAAATLIAAAGSNMLIFQRPRVAAAAYTDRRGLVHPAITAREGGYASVITGTCRPVVTELRTRRD